MHELNKEDTEVAENDRDPKPRKHKQETIGGAKIDCNA